MPRATPPIPGAQILQGLFQVATLPTPDASLVGTYARVSDLFGDKTDLVLCMAYAGPVYRWQPVRPQWAKTISVPGSNMTLSALSSPSILRITGTMTANRTITPDTTLAYPGHMYEIKMDGTLGLFTLTLAGLDLGATLSLLFGATRRIVFDGSAYQTL